MITKIAWYSAKGKIKDYLLLFSGLITSSAIFYMFQSLATDKRLLNETSYASTFTIVFQLGTVLLGVITFFYLLYANSFLMTMKRKTYGMLMMLGASKSKIILLNLLETLGICFVTTLTGGLIGILFSKLVTLFLAKALNDNLPTRDFVNLQAFWITLTFFVWCFGLTAILNGSSLAKEQLINLMKKQSLPDDQSSKLWLSLLQFLAGLLSLGLGYDAMYHILNWKMTAIIVAMVTVFLGSYLLIHSLVDLILSLIRQRKAVYFKKMNLILLAQLKYRIKSYTQILTVIAILFALALGALTVGLGFKNEGYKIANRALFYDLVLTQDNRQELDKISQDNIKNKSVYRFKVEAQRILLNQEDFDKHSFVVNGPISADGKVAREQFKAETFEKSDMAKQAFKNLLPEALKGKEIVVVSQKDLELSNGVNQSLILVKTTDFKKQYKTLAAIVKRIDRNGKSTDLFRSAQKVLRYKAYEKNLLAFEYMGFFLGIAFLTMLTSCLMFKILTSYKTDQERYKILSRIGATQQGIISVIQRELLVIFGIPAFLGTLHVLFGLQLFKMLLTNPYEAILMPIGLFLLIYFAYFYLTFKMYAKMVGFH